MTDLTMWVLYDHPRDFPDGFIARLWRGATPTDRVLVAESLVALRGKLRAIDMDLVIFNRADNDDPAIVEVWM